MIPKAAIEKAIEGGWKGTHIGDASFWTLEANWQIAALDPKFWQALGRTEFNDPTVKMLEDWKHRAHRFYDIILTGQDTKAFWDDLLTK